MCTKESNGVEKEAGCADFGCMSGNFDENDEKMLPGHGWKRRLHRHDEKHDGWDAPLFKNRRNKEKKSQSVGRGNRNTKNGVLLSMKHRQVQNFSKQNIE